MKSPPYSLRLFAIVLAAALMACDFGSLFGRGGGTDRPPLSGPSGTYDLTDIGSMLSTLNSYRLTLAMHFDGQQDGAASVWDITYTLLVSQQPAARLLMIDGTGFPGWMIGEIDGTRYFRDGRDEPCLAELVSEGEQVTMPDPLRYLLPVKAAQATGTELTVNGVSAWQYRADESTFGLEGEGEVTGELWVAAEGGYPVKYSLEANGGPGLLGSDIQGKMIWEYELTDINGVAPLSPPQGCPPGRVTAPHLDDAFNVIQIPGSLTYETGSDVAGAVAFYQQEMTTAGYVEASTYIDSGFSRLQYTQDSQTTTVYVWGGSSTTVQILLSADQAAVAATVVPTAESTALSAIDLSSAFSLIANMDREPVLPSYHIEVHQTRPEWDEQMDRMTLTDFTLSADIQGRNVHLVSSETRQGQAAKVQEGYIIGDEEYKVVGGSLQGSMGTIELAWVEWSMDLMPAIGTGSLGTAPQGTGFIEGRPVNMSVLDTAYVDPGILQTWLDMNPFSTAVTSANGTASIDQETGALLKLTLDYEAQALKLPDETVLGTGSGHIEITVSQIGSTTVQLP